MISTTELPLTTSGSSILLIQVYLGLLGCLSGAPGKVFRDISVVGVSLGGFLFLPLLCCEESAGSGNSDVESEHVMPLPQPLTGFV